MEFRLYTDENACSAAVSLQQWHNRLGHINIGTITQMSSDNLVGRLNLSDRVINYVRCLGEGGGSTNITNS